MSFPGADAYRDAPVLVLGASGFIGRWVAHALLRQSAGVTLAVRSREALEHLKDSYGLHGRVVETDLGRPGAARALIEQARPAIVFNLAGYGVDPAERDPE